MIIELIFIFKIASAPFECNLNANQIIEKIEPPLCNTCLVDSIKFGKFGSFCTVITYNSTNVDHDGQTLVWFKNGDFLGDIRGADASKVINKMKLLDRKYFENLQNELKSIDQN